ncbi:hypothetical protein EON80_25750 [bacterium]|nr:MAG: hypothetical protein EON80_25750 [bacterium]
MNIFNTIEPFALLCFLASAALYTEIHWRAAHRPVDKSKIIDQKLLAAFAFYFGLSFQGSHYPIVMRANSLINVTPTLLWASLPVAVVESIAFGYFLKRLQRPAPIVAALAGFIFFIVSVGHLQMLNGILDRSALKQHRVKVLNKEYIPGGRKSSPRWEISTEDWKRLVPQVWLVVSPQQFQAAQPGNAVEIQTSAGALGVERLLGWRLAKK